MRAILYFALLMTISGCEGSKYSEFFTLANEQLDSGYEWHYIGRKDATKEDIKYIPMYKGLNGEEYIHFQLKEPNETN